MLVPIVTALALMTAPAIAGAVEAGKGPYQPPRFENYRWIILSYFDGHSLINSQASSSIVFVNGRIQGAGKLRRRSAAIIISRAVSVQHPRRNGSLPTGRASK